MSLRSPSPFGRADTVARRAVALAAAAARAAGHRVDDATPPYPATLINVWVRHWLAGVAVEVEQLGLPVDRLEPRTRAVVAKGERLRRRRRPGPDEAAAWRRRVLDWFASFDVLLTPTIAHPAPAHGWATGRGYLRSYLNGARTVPYTQAWNLAGLPALSLPVGGSPTHPGAVQIIAASEEAVLRFARQMEATLADARVAQRSSLVDG